MNIVGRALVFGGNDLRDNVIHLSNTWWISRFTPSYPTCGPHGPLDSIHSCAIQIYTAYRHIRGISKLKLGLCMRNTYIRNFLTNLKRFMLNLSDDKTYIRTRIIFSS